MRIKRLCSITGATVSALVVLVSVALVPAQGETGREGWLRYASARPVVVGLYKHEQLFIESSGNTNTIEAARNELKRGLESMLGREWMRSPILPGRIELRSAAQSPANRPPSPVGEEGFWLSTQPC